MPESAETERRPRDYGMSSGEGKKIPNVHQDVTKHDEDDSSGYHCANDPIQLQYNFFGFELSNYFVMDGLVLELYYCVKKYITAGVHSTGYRHCSTLLRRGLCNTCVCTTNTILLSGIFLSHFQLHTNKQKLDDNFVTNLSTTVSVLGGHSSAMEEPTTTRRKAETHGALCAAILATTVSRLLSAP